VLDDADLDAAVNAAAFGAFAHQGQICMSTERIIADEKVVDAFVANPVAKASKLPAGDPREPVVRGSMIDLAPAEKMDALIADALGKGAVLACGGKRKGAVVEATLLDKATPATRLYAEESFARSSRSSAPRIRKARSRLANDTEYGLSAAAFGKDIMRAVAVAKRIRSGICHINGPTVQDEAQMPFGGVGASGYGRFGGKAAIDFFTEIRWITISGEPGDYPI
jgi:acyl-CoA reductase-like NAD-dependent aldehyde dehydrogenase